jgi:hypothetical protein
MEIYMIELLVPCTPFFDCEIDFEDVPWRKT